jgi:hypothetical protein
MRVVSFIATIVSGGSVLTGRMPCADPRSLRCYAAFLLHNAPAELVRSRFVSRVVKRCCGQAPSQGIILLSGHNGVATRFRRIIGSSPTLSLAA